MCACITGDVHAVVNRYALTFLYFFLLQGLGILYLGVFLG